KPRAKTIAGLARLAVADSIGQDDEVTGRVEQLAGAKQLAAERAREKPRAAPAGAMKNQHRIADNTGRVAAWRADRPIVKGERRERLPRLKLEIPRDVVGFKRSRNLGGCGGGD